MLSMMYAFGLPIFLILTLICLIMSYIIDKVIVAYYHRKPPMYDDTLNKTSVHFMKWGAVIYLAIAYWMASNRQMFGNNLNPKNYQDEVDVYDHYIRDNDPYWFQLILRWVAITLLVLLIIYDTFIGWGNMCLKSSAKTELQSLEYLPDYPECMPLKYIENTLMEEKIVREKFGYKNHFDSTIKDFLLARSKRNGKLDHQLTSQSKKLFTDATSFDILKQPSYYASLSKQATAKIQFLRV